MDSESTGKSKAIPAIIGLIVIVAIGAGIALWAAPGDADEAATASPTPSVASTSPASPDATTGSTTPSSATSAYQDGTYEAQGDYDSPGGNETVSVSVTLKNGVVTDSTVTTSARNPTGKRYQSLFVENYKEQVTGKNINDIRLSKVSGSSLTSSGFNNALARIKADAKA